MNFLTNSPYGKSTVTSLLIHGALLVTFMLMPPTPPVNSATNVTTMTVVPEPKPEVVPPPEEVKPIPTEPLPQEQQVAAEKQTQPLQKQAPAAGQPSPAPQAAALPGESAESVALQSGTGTAIPTMTGISSASPSVVGVPNGTPGGTGRGSVAASRTYGPKPSYPSAAREAGWEGSVVLRIRINTDGSVTVLSVREGGRDDINTTAVQVVSTWRYSPKYDDNGVPVASVRDVRVKFDLTENN